jgi:hypothetical protein
MEEENFEPELDDYYQVDKQFEIEENLYDHKRDLIDNFDENLYDHKRDLIDNFDENIDYIDFYEEEDFNDDENYKKNNIIETNKGYSEKIERIISEMIKLNKIDYLKNDNML